MFKNYLITIFRQIRKNTVFSSINILGLALGMSACLIIAQYVNFHSSFDSHYADADKIFRLESTAYKNGQELGQNIQSPAMFSQTLQEQSPAVTEFARFYNFNYANNSIIYKTEAKQVNFEQPGVFVTDHHTFQLFDLDFVAGGSEKFEEPQKAVMTEKTALKYFESPENAIGEVFSLSGNTGANEYELVGVLKDLPNNTHLNFEVLLSYPSLENYSQSGTSWTANDMYSYLKLSDETKQTEVLADINSLFEDNSKEIYEQSGYDLDFYLQPIQNIHLDTNAEDFSAGMDNRVIIALSIIAIVILFIAWINYLNLSLVKTVDRLKEVGIRKCMGSTVSQITALFVMEALVMNLLALVLAIGGTLLLEGSITEITGLPSGALLNQNVLLAISGLIVLGTVVIGFYPYLLLKTMKVVNVLVGHKGKIGGTKLRKSLVFVQFVITFLLIAGTLTVYNQISYMREADLGINIENILVIKSPPGDINEKNREDLARFSTLKTELLKYASITEITNAGEIPGEPVNWGAGIYLKNGSKENSVGAGLVSMDLDFTTFFGIELVAGRELREGDDPWSKGDVVINEKMAEMLGFATPEEAVGADLAGFYAPITVRGVMENHHHTSLHDDYRPLVYILSSWTEYYFVKLQLDDNLSNGRHEQLAENVKTVEAEWNKIFTDFQIDYFFLDKSFDAQYKEDIRFGKIFSTFSGLAILIACLGLFGLTSFTIQQRTKEIGIRKTLGASVNNLMLLLSKEYLLLVFVACIMGLPLAYWLMSLWLENYVFRIELGWWFYTIPLVFLFAMAVLSIISKVVSTVRVNPVESLRYE